MRLPSLPAFRAVSSCPLYPCTPDAYRPPIAPMLHPFPDDVIDNPVFLALVGRHDVVPFGIVLDALERLPGVVHQNLVQALAGAQQFTSVDVDVGRLAGQPMHEGLMDEDARVG